MTTQTAVIADQTVGVNTEERGMLFFEMSYPLDLENLFEATGCYHRRDGDNFALSPVPANRLPEDGAAIVKYEAKLFDFGWNINRRNARRRIYRAGWVPAGHEHMLALLAKYPMGCKPIDPISGNKLIALAAPVTIAFTLAGMGGCNRAMKEHIGEKGHYGPSAPIRYLGVRRIP